MDNAFEKIENVDDLFKELDENKYADLAQSAAAYRNELMKNGFTRREAIRFVEAHNKFMYDMAIEAYLNDGPDQSDQPYEEVQDEVDDDSSDDYTD